MKKTHIAVVIMIAIGVGVLITASSQMGTYGTFTDAMNTNGIIKVVGELSKDKEMYYNPEENANYFSFYMKDEEGVERKVVYKERPQDFEKSESIVIDGKMEGDEFHATNMLLKCPSKYQDEERRLKERS